jgi:predicted nucleic acid-binding protein
VTPPLGLLAEYREVLLRPGVRRRHGLSAADVEALLTDLALNASVRDPPPATGVVPDVGDRHLWALLQSDSAAVLVTGDDALLERPPSRAESCLRADFFPCCATAGER